MSELFGPLPRHVVARVPLVWAVLAPLAAAAVVGLLGSRLDARPGGRSSRAPSDLVVAGAAFVAALVAATALVSALSTPSGLVVSPAWLFARTGSIDASFGFDADVGRAALAVAVALGAAFVSLRGDRRDRPGGLGAWRALALAAVLAALLADGLATALLAFGVALVATGAGSIRGRWLPGGAAAAALVLAGVVLAWGLEGRWLDGLSGNYLSDYGPRFVAVRDDPAQAVRPRGPAVQGKGSITMTSAAGADVYVGVADDAALRGRAAPLATSPFVAAPVSASLHKIAIVPGAAAIVGGDGVEIALCDNVDIRPGDDVVVTPLGATWTWRDLAAQMRLRDGEGKHPLRSGFASKALGPAAVPTWVVALAFLAAVLAWIDGPRRVVRAIALRGPLDGGFVAAVLAVSAVAPAARLAPLVPLASAAVLLVLAAVLVVLGLGVASSRGGWLPAGIAAAATGAGLVAVAADAPPVVALGAALLAAGGVVFADATVRRPPPSWLAGAPEDDPVAPAPPLASVSSHDAPPEQPADAAARKTKRTKSKKRAEARS